MSALRGRHLRRIGTSLAACLLAVTLSTVVAPQVATAAGTATPDPASAASGPVTRTGLDLAAAIDNLGTSTYASIYGGIIGVDNGRQVDVYLTVPDPAAEAAFEALAPPGVLVFAPTRRTAIQLNAVHQRLINAIGRLRALGITLVRFWPDLATGTEHIGVENLTTAASTTVTTSLGTGDLNLFNTTAADIATATTTRTSDTPAYNGGDSITNDKYGGGCTSGFGIKISSTTYLLTAAHCYGVGETIHNAACTAVDCSTSRTGSNVTMGTVSKRDTTDGDLDTEYINTRGSNLVFTGAIGANTKADVSGKTTSPSGYQVCSSGSYSGEQCDLVIDNTSECELFSLPDLGLHTFCDLVHAYSPSHAIANEGGNSGGPVFRFSGSSLLATGTITGSTSADTVTCKHYTYNSCFWDIYYTNINNIVSHWGASIVT